jgi:uncharacterized protein YndB with AHSA1/START domain
MTSTEQVEKRELAVIRTFNAPREKVWRAYTDPDLVKQWWGPKGFTAPIIEAELKAGGRYLYCMRSPDGKDYWSVGVYKEFSPPERIVAIDSFADREGNIVPASYYGLSSDWPLESEMTIILEDVDGRTRMTMRQQDVPVGPDRDNSIQGWNESMDKLAEFLEETDGGCKARVHGGIRREED